MVAQALRRFARLAASSSGRVSKIKTLRRCDPEGRDGTKLPACFKVYLPAPDGKFGMVLRFIRDGESLALRYLAFGVRHHPRDSNALTVYEIADRRFHDKPS